MDTLRTITRNIVHFLASHVVSFVLGMAASIMMARSLGPHDLGIFHQVQWFTGTVSVVISLGFITSITKFTAQYRAEGRQADVVAAVRFIFIIEVAIALVATAGLLLFTTSIADHYFSPDQTFIFALSFIAITPGIQTAIFSAVLEGAQVFRYQTLHSLTITPVALLTKVFLMVKGFGLESLFWANLGFALANLAFYFWASRREGLLTGWFSRSKGTGKWKDEILRYNRSMTGIHFVDILVWSRSENYFLGRFCPAAQIAYFNLAQNLIAKLTGIIPTVMWKILLPLSAEQHGRSQDERMKKTYLHAVRYSAFVAFPCVTFCFISAYELIVIFYGHAYAESETCFQILCSSALLSTLAQPGSAAIYATNRQGFILKYGSVLAVLNIALCIWLIPRYGAKGAAICYASTSCLGVLGGFVFLVRGMGFQVPWKAIAKISGASLCMGLVLHGLLQANSPWFDLFMPMRMLLDQWTGHDFEILMGARTVRVGCACLLAGSFYLTLALCMFRPTEDDRKILSALYRFIPRPLNRLLAWKYAIGASVLELPVGPAGRKG